VSFLSADLLTTDSLAEADAAANNYYTEITDTSSTTVIHVYVSTQLNDYKQKNARLFAVS